VLTVISAETDDYVQLIASLGLRNLPPGGQATLDEMLGHLGKASRIVDVGCNTGWSTAIAAAARPDALIVGVDISAEMVATAARLHQSGNLSFRRLDVSELDTHLGEVDAVICAGSSAFFADQPAAYAAIRRTLRAHGLFINAHYVYDSTTPKLLRQRASAAFGLSSVPYSAAECLSDYEAAGLTLLSYHRRNSWTLPTSAKGFLLKSILRSDERFREWMIGIDRYRNLIRKLEPYRHPVVVTSTNAIQSDSAEAAVSTDQTLRVLRFFRAPFKRQPIERLRQMLPFEFLAYIGDPDAAPGGAAAVSAVAQTLESLGLDRDAAILDVGSFTGMSTFALARTFRRTVGVDIDPIFVGAATILGAAISSPARFLELDARSTALPSASQDAVVMTATLGYTPEPAALIREAVRLIRPGGFLVEFFYHHPDADPAFTAGARESVGPDIQFRALSSQVNDVESEGLRLLKLRRVSIPSQDRADTNYICVQLSNWESESNPYLTSEEHAEFEKLLRRYAGRGIAPPRQPHAYMCVFCKPATA
jgi:SAM-dependent methyltransferase